MQLFYVSPDELKANQLSEEESNHCIRVLRKKINDEIHLIDGVGGKYKARITDANPKKCVFNILASEKVSYNLPDLHIAMAPTKNIDRFEFFIEKACELGIKEITPVITFNSERRHINTEKLIKKMIAACKQSYTLYFPKVNEAVKFKDLLAIEAQQKLMGHCYSHETPHLKTINSQLETLLLIGPEGDFSQEEVTMAEKKGFKAISLGEKRLRTETAGVFACAVFNLNQ